MHYAHIDFCIFLSFLSKHIPANSYHSCHSVSCKFLFLSTQLPSNLCHSASYHSCQHNFPFLSKHIPATAVVPKKTHIVSYVCFSYNQAILQYFLHPVRTLPCCQAAFLMLSSLLRVVCILYLCTQTAVPQIPA